MVEATVVITRIFQHILITFGGLENKSYRLWASKANFDNFQNILEISENSEIAKNREISLFLSKFWNFQKTRKYVENCRNSSF